jgi:hypothetical protein
LPEKISFTRAFWFIVHEDYARLERIRIVSEAIIQHMRRRIGARPQSTAGHKEST